jgi:hypothetical protein
MIAKAHLHRQRCGLDSDSSDGICDDPPETGTSTGWATFGKILKRCSFRKWDNVILVLRAQHHARIQGDHTLGIRQQGIYVELTDPRQCHGHVGQCENHALDRLHVSRGHIAVACK